MIKALIFDFYGVIRSDEYHDWLTNHGLKASPKLKSAEVSLDKGLETMDDFFENLSKFSDMPASDIKREFKHHASLNKELLALILELKKSYKIALLSNAASSHLRETLDEAGIGKLFDEIVISAEIGYMKPSKEIFNYCLEKLAVRPEEAVFIDDNQRFVEAAKSLGIESISYTGLDSLINTLSGIGIIGK
ncbi:MAG TPA: HAD family phosphatase [Candidatus Saccharimonadales bacterium]